MTHSDENLNHDETASHLELEHYGEDAQIASYEGRKIPTFLILTYCLLPIWGIVQFYFFWNGSTTWFDPGYWHELQIAANTTLPTENADEETSNKLPAKQLK